MLPKEHRLRKKRDIDALFLKGRAVFERFLTVKTVKNNLKVSRFAVIVGGKVSKSSVARNRIRRRVRAIVHDHLAHTRPGFDAALIIKPQALTSTHDELSRSVAAALKKAGLLEEPIRL